MKKTVLILILGLGLGLAGYFGLYTARTAQLQQIAATSHPELEWLKIEFSLNPNEFEHIKTLHEGYLPQCAKMCAKIAAANQELQSLVTSTNQVTAQIQEKMAEISRLRLECQGQMLQHFYDVSRSMAPSQGQRYLAHMQQLTSLGVMRDHSTTHGAGHHDH